MIIYSIFDISYGLISVLFSLKELNYPAAIKTSESDHPALRLQPSVDPSMTSFLSHSSRQKRVNCAVNFNYFFITDVKLNKTILSEIKKNKQKQTTNPGTLQFKDSAFHSLWYYITDYSLLLHNAPDWRDSLCTQPNAELMRVFGIRLASSVQSGIVVLFFSDIT